MANVYNKVLLAGLQANYDALQTKDANVLYFCTDTAKFYKGSIDFSNHVVIAGTKPGAPVVGKIYILGDTGTVETWDGSAWKVMSYPIATTVAASSDDVHVVSAKAVYDAIQTAIGEVTGGAAILQKVECGTTDGHLKITKGDQTTEDIALNGVVTTPTWDASTRKLTLPVVGGDAIEINIGKDIFLDPEADNKYNEETQKIELHLNDGTTIEIPAADLVDVYTGATANGTSVSVSEDNKISVNLVVDPDENNALVVTAAGIKVDLSAYCKTVDVEAKVKVAQDAADAAAAAAKTANAAIAVLNGDSTTAGSVDKKVKDAVDALKAGEIKAAQDAADAAQGDADDANAAIAVLNGTGDGSVAKAVADESTVLKNGVIKDAQDAADTAQSAADTAQETANDNAEEIAAIVAALGWGTF